MAVGVFFGTATPIIAHAMGPRRNRLIKGDVSSPWNRPNSYESELDFDWARPGLFRHYAQVLGIFGGFGVLGVAAYLLF
jgi:hypothetical protein